MRYHNITKDDMLNGDGLRVVLWVAGCEHHCPNCQNPVTWDINGGLEFDEAAKKEIFDELEKNYVSGITFSGGDPLHTQNRKDVGALIEEIKEKFNRYEESSSLLLPVYNVYRLMSKTFVRTSD